MIYFCTSQASTYLLKLKWLRASTAYVCCWRILTINTFRVVFAVWLWSFYAPKRYCFQAAWADFWISTCFGAGLFFSHILSLQCAASALLYGRSGATSPLLPPLCTLTSLLTFLDGIARVPHSRILPDWDHVYKKIGLMQRFPLFKIYSRPPADQKRGHSLHLGSQSGQYAWKNASSRGTNVFLDAKKLACAPRMGHHSRI